MFVPRWLMVLPSQGQDCVAVYWWWWLWWCLQPLHWKRSQVYPSPIRNHCVIPLPPVWTFSTMCVRWRNCQLFLKKQWIADHASLMAVTRLVTSCCVILIKFWYHNYGLIIMVSMTADVLMRTLLCIWHHVTCNHHDDVNKSAHIRTPPIWHSDILLSICQLSLIQTSKYQHVGVFHFNHHQNTIKLYWYFCSWFRNYPVAQCDHVCKVIRADV